MSTPSHRILRLLATGILAAALTPLRAEAPLIGINTHFGIRDKRATYTTARGLLEGLQVQSVRDEAYWTQIEADDGQLSFPADLLETYRGLHERGIRLLITLGYNHPRHSAPTAAPTPSAFGFEQSRQYNHNRPETPENRKAYARYCRFVAETLKEFHPIYQIWNEWSLPLAKHRQWQGLTPEELVIDARLHLDLIRAAAPEIREADPGAKILVGCLMTEFIRQDWDTAFLDALADEIGGGKEPAAGAGESKASRVRVDGISLHPYNSKCRQGVADLTCWLAEKLDSRPALRDLGLYVTEFGWGALEDVEDKVTGKRAVRFDNGVAGAPEEIRKGLIVDCLEDLTTRPRLKGKLKGAWLYDLVKDGVDARKWDQNLGIVSPDGRTGTPTYFKLKAYLQRRALKAAQTPAP